MAIPYIRRLQHRCLNKRIESPIRDDATFYPILYLPYPFKLPTHKMSTSGIAMFSMQNHNSWASCLFFSRRIPIDHEIPSHYIFVIIYSRTSQFAPYRLGKRSQRFRMVVPYTDQITIQIARVESTTWTGIALLPVEFKDRQLLTAFLATAGQVRCADSIAQVTTLQVNRLPVLKTPIKAIKERPKSWWRAWSVARDHIDVKPRNRLRCCVGVNIPVPLHKKVKVKR